MPQPLTKFTRSEMFLRPNTKASSDSSKGGTAYGRDTHSFQLHMNLHPSFYSSQSNSLLERFTNICKELRHITEPSARKVMVLELIDLYTEAEEFFEENEEHLNQISLNQMRHMLARPISEHLILTKPSTNLISNTGN